MPQTKPYKKTFLKQVIFRVDFAEFLDNELLSEEALAPLLTKLKIRGITQEYHEDTGSMQIDAQGNLVVAKSERKAGRIISFSNTSDENTNTVKISNKFIIGDFMKYSSSRDAFSIIDLALETYYKIATVNTTRIGLRYINTYPESDIKLNQSFFNGKIKNSLSMPLPQSKYIKSLVSSLSKDEYFFDDIHLNVRYGWLRNNASIQAGPRRFTLDFDCYSQDTYGSYSTILDFIKIAYSHIETIFEEAITEKMRSVMNEN